MAYIKGTNILSTTEETTIFPIEEGEKTLFLLETGKNKPREICPHHETSKVHIPFVI